MQIVIDKSAFDNYIIETFHLDTDPHKNKVAAVKFLRNLTKAGLYDAVHYINGLIAKMEN